MEWESAKSSKSNTLFLKNGCVNVYGSEYTTSPPDSETSSGILYNELYARWLLQMTKHVCNNFHKTRDAIINPPTAIIIDNSPGCSSYVSKLREWLTDMGPVIGKFVTVSSLDVRDLEASVDEMKSTHDILTKKWQTASYYCSGWMPGSENLFDKTFFQRLCECGYYCDSKDKGDNDKDNDNDFNLFERCSKYYCDDTLLYPDTHDARVEADQILNRYQYQALVINKVPKDVIADQPLSGHSTPTKKFVATTLRKHKRDNYTIGKFFLFHREFLLPYAHLASNMAYINEDEQKKYYEEQQKIIEEREKIFENDKTLRTRNCYVHLQIHWAKQLCAELQRNLSEVRNYFNQDQSWKNTWEKYNKGENSPGIQKLFGMFNLLHFTMKELLSILDPFTQDDMYVLFPFVTHNRSGIERYSYKAPVNAFLEFIAKKSKIRYKNDFYSPGFKYEGAYLEDDSINSTASKEYRPESFFDCLIDILNRNYSIDFAMPIAYYNFLFNSQITVDEMALLTEKDKEAISCRFTDMVADTAYILSLLKKGIDSPAFLHYTQQKATPDDYRILFDYRNRIRKLTGISAEINFGHPIIIANPDDFNSENPVEDGVNRIDSPLTTEGPGAAIVAIDVLDDDVDKSINNAERFFNEREFNTMDVGFLDIVGNDILDGFDGEINKMLEHLQIV